jgi:hypothetical protein
MAIIGLMIYMKSSDSDSDSADESIPSETIVPNNPPPAIPNTPLSFVISDPNNIKPNEKQSFT